jgi:acetyl-CoA/propionyl-CoA carboxylase carboxyl transferase subunit
MQCAVGQVGGTPVLPFAPDAAVQGGARCEGCEAILVAGDRALADKLPIVRIWHSGGARQADGVLSLRA